MPPFFAWAVLAAAIHVPRVQAGEAGAGEGGGVDRGSWWEMTSGVVGDGGRALSAPANQPLSGRTTAA